MQAANSTSSGRCVRISTDDVPPGQRLDYWLSSSISTIVGVDCATFSPNGLQARQVAMKVDGCGIVEVSGNEHVIERTPTLIKKYPKESLFLDLLVQGKSFHYQTDECVTSVPGDLVLYDADEPYVHGFGSGMRQITFDISHERLRELRISRPSPLPMKISGITGPAKMIAKSLMAKIQDIADQTQAPDAISQVDQHAISDLLAVALKLFQPEADLSASQTLALLRAQAYIVKNLRNPDLDFESVAQASQVSLRHLQRIFEATGLTLRQFVLARRVAQCAQALKDPTMRTATITDICYYWGFRDAAHFCRSFKDRFGRSPRAFRDCVEPYSH